MRRARTRFQIFGVLIRRALGVVALCALASSCVTTLRPKSKGLGEAGHGAMAAVNAYYDEVRRIPRLMLRESIIKDAIATEHVTCTRPEFQDQCEPERKMIKESYGNLSSEARSWDSAFRTRKALIKKAENAYAAYQELAEDDFVARIDTGANSLAQTVSNVTATPLPKGQVGQIAQAMATAYENKQLSAGAAYLKSMDDGVLALLRADRAAFETMYEKYLDDYEANTVFLLKEDYASRNELASGFIADRKLKKGTKDFAAMPAVQSSLVAFAAEDVRAVVSDSLKAGDAAEKLLETLSRAHSEMGVADDIDQVISATERLQSLVQGMSEYKHPIATVAPAGP